MLHPILPTPNLRSGPMTRAPRSSLVRDSLSPENAVGLMCHFSAMDQYGQEQTGYIHRLRHQVQ